MRVIMVLLLAVLAACASGSRGDGGLEGSYELVRINGGALPAPSPTEDGVTMQGATLRLMPDGRFAMDARATTGSDGERSDEEAQGTWSVTGDTIVMLPDVSGGDPPSFRWTLAEGTLTLYDEDGHAYTFRRT
jgi:hypothetical protein